MFQNLSKEQIELDKKWNEMDSPKVSGSGRWCATCINELPHRHVIPPVPNEHTICPECQAWRKESSLDDTTRKSFFKKEIPSIAKDKLKELQGRKVLIEEVLTKAKLEWVLKKDAPDYDKEGLAYEYRRYETLQKELDEIEKQISKWKWYSKPPSKQKSSFNVDEIKSNVLIETLLGSPKRRSGGRSYHICPLHNDSNPSLVVYEDQNSWWCYPCSTGGSVIDLYMKMNNVDFVTACKELSG